MSGRREMARACSPGHLPAGHFETDFGTYLDKIELKMGRVGC